MNLEDEDWLIEYWSPAWHEWRRSRAGGRVGFPVGTIPFLNLETAMGKSKSLSAIGRYNYRIRNRRTGDILLAAIL